MGTVPSLDDGFIDGRASGGCLSMTMLALEMGTDEYQPGELPATAL
jgi:hypothetical protein